MSTFTPRTFDEILADATSYMVGVAGSVTDFNTGSVIRTLLEAFALEVTRLNFGMLVGLNEAQEQAAYTTFGFGRLAAQRAYGTVQFTMDPTLAAGSSVVIPQGTVVAVGGSTTLQFSTQAPLTLSTTSPIGLVSVIAQSAGAAGNVASGAIGTLVSSVAGVTAITNPRPFITGSDTETDNQRRERFAYFISGLHRATKHAVIYGVKTATLYDQDGYIIEQVLKANTVELSPGVIGVYVHNGAANTSTALVNQAQKVLTGYRDPSGAPHEGWKAAGITALVSPATEVPQDVSVAVEVEDGRLPDIVNLAVQNALMSVFSSLDVGDTLRVELLKEAVRHVPGVLDILTWTLPAQNLLPLPSQIVVRGNLIVSTTATTGDTFVSATLGE